MYRFPIVITTALIALSATPVAAQTPEACTTNTGLPGVIFSGHFNAVVAPEGFDRVDVHSIDKNGSIAPAIPNNNLYVFADAALQQNILLASISGSQSKGQAALSFKDADNRVIESCAVDIVPFDPAQHDLSVTAFGYCDFNQMDGVLQLTTGTAQVFDLPQDYREGATSPTAILEHAPVYGAGQVTLTAKSAGVATFVWMGRNDGNGALKGLCPVLVSDAPN